MITEGFPGCGVGLNVDANLSSLFFLTVPLTVAEPKFFSEYTALTTTTAPRPTFLLLLLLLFVVLLREEDVVVVESNLLEKEEEEEEEVILLVVLVVAALKSDALIVIMFYYTLLLYFKVSIVLRARAVKVCVEEKSGEEVDIRPMRFFCPIFFCFLAVEKAKGGAKRGGRETLTRIYNLCV